MIHVNMSKYFIIRFVPYDRFGLTIHSKVWIGAWWIGFLFIALICLLLSIPILAYPSSLPGNDTQNTVTTNLITQNLYHLCLVFRFRKAATS